jgi:hypothetical protein
MSLQNRVTPFGDIVAIAQRGLFTGNRGIIHDPATRTMLKKDHFLDEAVALACRAPPLLFLPASDCGSLPRPLVQRQRRKAAAGCGDGCGAAREAARPRTQASASAAGPRRRIAGRRDIAAAGEAYTIAGGRAFR